MIRKYFIFVLNQYEQLNCISYLVIFIHSIIYLMFSESSIFEFYFFQISSMHLNKYLQEAFERSNNQIDYEICKIYFKKMYKQYACVFASSQIQSQKWMSYFKVILKMLRFLHQLFYIQNKFYEQIKQSQLVIYLVSQSVSCLFVCQQVFIFDHFCLFNFSNQ
ncbi:transmembrane protein, putative (macronuclear) [Tetrahymena thermophila SB210]|uniref:Transmembrane protein, putative n=1 Tax=Tetrahymena thermophila (strain SB210) TaxID=312017 RepID=W7XJK9_TETTS|nr:transmembrane protein, putative [Tetrahymena thermophila SB210]EWS74239.1 transmembrane protein, putative [Tetrahymena thermophila SB210]|eukprot:XP_012653212.1 transmembrane protein, putative [Tetrahymena thermophila SB210]